MKQQRTSVASVWPASPAPATRTRPRWDIVPNSRPVERSFSADDKRVTIARSTSAGRELPAVSLLFAAGDRAGVDRVRALSVDRPSFRVSFDPENGAGVEDFTQAGPWLEVLANGLSFDLLGLAPGIPQPLPPGTHRYGLPPDFDDALEAITLRPGPSIAACGRMLPVVRTLAMVAAMLADLPGVSAVGWHAARAWSSPAHFRGSVLRWIEGGAFPGLGLTALAPTPGGGLQSEGLALFSGQELRLAPELARDRAAGARLALRLLHWSVEHGRLDEATRVAGPSGEPLVLEPSENKRFVGVSRG